MNERISAEILVFPKAPPARLSQALEGLDAALADQKTAVMVWQTTLRDLRDSMTNLRKTVTGYQTALKILSVNVSAIGAETRRLEAWADATIARHAPASDASATDAPATRGIKAP